jgi:hypothetical protein
MRCHFLSNSGNPANNFTSILRPHTGRLSRRVHLNQDMRHSICLSSPWRSAASLLPLAALILAVVPSVFGTNRALAQFIDVTIDHALTSSTQATFLGCGMSFADYNADGLDDLTFANYQGGLKIFTQSDDGFVETDLGIDFQGEPKAVLWFDYDNDGDQDLLVTVNNAPNKLYCNVGGVLMDCSEEAGIEAASDWLSFGATAGDYDLDGYLDLYICNYHDGSVSSHPNILYHNNGDGTFSDVTAIAGVGNGLGHTFQAAWFEYDFDGYPDLFVVNDRDVFSNAIYRNLGDGTFEDIAPALGAGQNIWAMSASIGDPDNDGDFELFCSNITNQPNLLLDKMGDNYYDLSEWSGVSGERYSWGGAWIDYDGDMRQDLLVATYRFPLTQSYDNYMYHNSGEALLFTNVSNDWPNEQTELYCLGVGDINQDLAPDVVGHGNDPVAQVLQNTGVDASDSPNRLTVRLHGTMSNRDGVGAIIRVYADGTTQMRHVQAGQDFMTQHSATQFFGLAENLSADSIVVSWPSGVQDAWYDVLANQALFLVERSTSATVNAFGSPCNGEEAWAEYDMTADETYWNGELSEDGILQLDTSGVYPFEAHWLNGLFVVHDTLFWDREPLLEMTVEWSPPACSGESGVLVWHADAEHFLTWNGVALDPNGSSDTTAAGILTLSLTSPLTGCNTDFQFNLVEPAPLLLALDYQPASCADDTAQCVATGSGGTPGYLVNWAEANPLHLAQGDWPVEVSDAHGCQAFDTLQVVIPEPLEVTFEVVHEDDGDGVITAQIAGGTPPFEPLWNTGSTALQIDSLVAGIYSCVVVDAGGCLAVGAVQLLNIGIENGQKNPCAHWSVHRSSGQLTLHAPGDDCAAHRMEVFSLDGRKIAEGKCLGDRCVINTPDRLPLVVVVWDVSGICLFRSWIPAAQ